MSDFKRNRSKLACVGKKHAGGFCTPAVDALRRCLLIRLWAFCSQNHCVFISASVPVQSFIVNTGLLLADMATFISCLDNRGKVGRGFFFFMRMFGFNGQNVTAYFFSYIFDKTCREQQFAGWWNIANVRRLSLSSLVNEWNTFFFQKSGFIAQLLSGNNCVSVVSLSWLYFWDVFSGNCLFKISHLLLQCLNMCYTCVLP